MIFISGCRGSGKTTLAKYLSEHFRCSYLQYSEFNIDQAIKRWGYLDWEELSTPKNAQWINNLFIKRIASELKSNNVIIDGHLSYYDSPAFTDKQVNDLLSLAESLLVHTNVPSNELCARICASPRDRRLKISDIKIDQNENKRIFTQLKSKPTNHLTKFASIDNLELNKSQSELTSIVGKFLKGSNEAA